MKGYLVNIENNEFETYLLYTHEAPVYDKNAKRWFGFGEPIAVDKNHISKYVKLPEKGKVKEVNVLIVNNKPNKFQIHYFQYLQDNPSYVQYLLFSIVY